MVSRLVSARNKLKMFYCIGYEHIGTLLSDKVKQEIIDNMVVTKALAVRLKATASI